MFQSCSSIFQKCVFPDRSLCERTAAESDRMKLLSGSAHIHRPECAPDGSFKALQCDDTVSECWCVGLDGFEVPDTRSILDENALLQECRKTY